jgi:hypothetical protein
VERVSGDRFGWFVVVEVGGGVVGGVTGGVEWGVGVVGCDCGTLRLRG